MKKRTIIIPVSLMIIPLITCCDREIDNFNNNTFEEKIVLDTSTEDNKSLEEDELEIDNIVDSQIAELIKSEEFDKGTIEEREKIVKPLLYKLEGMGYIKNLYYNSDEKTFTFQYYSGALGGLMIKEFNPMMN